MMELILKTIIGPIVVGVVLRLVDKWLNKDRQCQKRPQAYLDVSLGSFLVHDIELILNSSPLSHSSQNLSKFYIFDFSRFNHCTTKQSRLRENQRFYQFHRNFDLVNEETILHVTPRLIRHYWTRKIIITAVPVLQLTVTYNQIEFEVAKVTTNLFLSHISSKSPRQFPDQNPKNTEKYRKMIFRIVPKSLKQSQKTPPDWVELREIIMKKKSLGFY